MGCFDRSLHGGPRIDYKKDIKRVYGDFEDLCNQVRDGLIDATVSNVNGGIALTPSAAALAFERKLVFLEWDPKAVESLSAQFPYFNKVIVRAAALPGRQTDHLTVNVGARCNWLRGVIGQGNWFIRSEK